LCLNFIENGTCHIDGRKCILGPRGAAAKNEDGECELQGGFDVWLLNQSILVTDLGPPAKEPVRDLALGVNENVAMSIASDNSKKASRYVTTSKRTCIRCGGLYWMSQHLRVSGLAQIGHTKLCPKCVDSDDADIASRLGERRQWCG